MTACFDCGDPATEDHHVVPRSRGGTKTVPLCARCHGLVHGIARSDDHSTLTKEGLARARASGKRLGRAPGLPAVGGGVPAPIEPAVAAVVRDALGADMSPRMIAERLNDYGLASPRGGRWHRESVRRLIPRLKAAA